MAATLHYNIGSNISFTRQKYSEYIPIPSILISQIVYLFKNLVWSIYKLVLKILNSCDMWFITLCFWLPGNFNRWKNICDSGQQKSQIHVCSTHVACHMSLTPTATATDPPPANSPIIHGRLAHSRLAPKHKKVEKRKKKKIIETKKKTKKVPLA